MMDEMMLIDAHGDATELAENCVHRNGSDRAEARR